MNENPVTWDGWLTIKCPAPEGYGRRTSAGLTKKKPNLDADQVAVKVSVSLPVSLFVRPALEATLTVPPGSVAPPVIDLEIHDTVEEVLRDRTGFDVRVCAANEEDAEWLYPMS